MRPDAIRTSLPFATAHGRVIVTYDADYLALHRSGVPHTGIAWTPASKYRIGQLVHMLVLLHAVLDRDAMKDHVEYL